MNHEHFASIYDYLMKDAPYSEWVKYTRERIPTGSTIVDVACGTGTLALELFRSGYKVSGVDISQDMLTIAENKFREAQCQIPLFAKDMRALDGFSNLDGVTLYCDGLNYLIDENDVKATFQHIHNVLKTGGTFLFDVHSVFKMEHIFDDQLYGTNDEEVSYLWFSSPGDTPFSVEHTLTFFIKNNTTGYYERKDEEHHQRTFPLEKYLSWLDEVGFKEIEVTSDFGRSKPSELDERYFFSAIKK